MPLQVFLKGLPLGISIILTIFLPFLLKRRTHDNAVMQELMVDFKQDDKPHDKLDNLLKWRDLVIAFVTSLFVLEFSAAQEITSNSHFLAFIPLPDNWKLSDVATITVVGLALFPLFGWLLTERLSVKFVEKDRNYWFLFAILVIFWYFLSFLFVYST